MTSTSNGRNSLFKKSPALHHFHKGFALRGHRLRLNLLSMILFAGLFQFGIADTVFHCIVEPGHTVLHAEAGNLPGIFQRGGDSLRQLAIDRHTAACLQESRQGGAFQFCHRPFDRACAGDDCLGIAFQQAFQLFGIVLPLPDVYGVFAASKIRDHGEYPSQWGCRPGARHLPHGESGRHAGRLSIAAERCPGTHSRQIVLLQSIDALYPIGTQYRNKMIFFARFDIGRPECFRAGQ